MIFFFKYIKVGVLNTIIGLSVTIFCLNILDMDYNISYFLGYAIGLVNSFILNKFYTFQSTNGWKKEVIPFILVFVIAYIISHILLFGFVEVLNIDENIAILLSMGVYTIISFILNKKIFIKEINV